MTVTTVPAPSLVDGFGRIHRDLRVSLTDRCNLRCTYCMPAEGLPWIPSEELLTVDELVRVIEVGTRLGIREVRLTGGEPLLRPDIVDLVRRICSLPARPEVSLTTNGLALARLAQPLADAGLTRVNVSLDTLRPERFTTIARRDRLSDVLAGLRAARAAGLAPVKVNAVLLRGVNDDEAVDLVRFALDAGLEMRFIEQMPLDAQGRWRRADMVTADEILTSLRSAFTLTPLGDRQSAPAERWCADGRTPPIGVIASVTRPFCSDCDRLRLTADGQLRACLFARGETDLRTLIRSGGDNETIVAAVTSAFEMATAGKQAGHGIGEPSFVQPDRPMSAIGG